MLAFWAKALKRRLVLTWEKIPAEMNRPQPDFLQLTVAPK